MKKWIPAAATAAGAYLIAIAPRLCERPERMPKVYYAHRGLHDNISDAPENSLAAFQKAVDAGYGIELDVYIPSIKFALEYDGSHWHKEKVEKDNQKDAICMNSGVRLIRIRETPLPNTASAVCYSTVCHHSNTTLSALIEKVLYEQFGIQLNVDVSRDSFDIINKFLTDICLKFRCQFIDRAGKHKVLPYHQAKFITKIKEPVLRIIAAAPDTYCIKVRSLALKK